MYFIIKWRNPYHRKYDKTVFTGLSKYATRELAEHQIKRFRSICYENLYYIEQRVAAS